VEDRHGGTSGSSGSSYTVQRGDTLYSIAFRYGLDYRKLGAANSIPAPYTIYPGQRLQLKEAAVPVTASRKAQTKTSTVPSTTKPASTPAPKPAPVTTVSSKPVTKPSSTNSAAASATGPVSSWRWPSNGTVLRKYSSTVHKGIDIGGKRGDPVVAVAGGEVVYAGTGIVGLGELLIVKHNNVYLSAYGHNDRLLVSEGDPVKAGQKIALKGSSGTDAVRLHFEIRKEGKPIDPLRLLPRR
jgi:lipoprotein NlpD